MKWRFWQEEPRIVPVRKQVHTYTPREEEREYTDYTLEICMRNGQKHVVGFETELQYSEWMGILSTDVTEARKSLTKYLEDINDKVFVLMNAEYRRTAEIDYCRVEPVTVKRLYKWTKVEVVDETQS